VRFSFANDNSPYIISCRIPCSLFCLSPMPVIEQGILSGLQYPRTLTVKRVTAADAARQFTKCLSEPGTEDIVPVGIAYHISSKGDMDFMCLAQPNTEDILLISLRNSKFGELAALLCAEGGSCQPPSPKVCLVGFGMPQIAVLISHATSLRVRGVDLLTLLRKSSPSEVIQKMVGKGVKSFAVGRLWMGNKASATKDIALRAWLAAWYVPDVT